MITAEGAGVLATIIPIGLLIVGFEVRSASVSNDSDALSVVSRWYLTILFGLGLLLGFAAEGILVVAVASSSSVEGLQAATVWAGLIVLGSGSFALMGSSIVSSVGLIDWLVSRSRKDT